MSQRKPGLRRRQTARGYFRRAILEPLETRSLLAPLVNAGSASDLVFNLPAAASTVILEDDGVAGNGISQLRSTNGTFDTTTFSNPAGSLTLNRGNAVDALTINALPDLTSGLTAGSALNAFGSVVIGGEISLAPDKSLAVYASGSLTLPNVTSAITTKGTGGITLTTKRNMVVAAGARIATVDGPVVLSANRQSPSTAGDFVGLIVSGAVTTSGKGNVSLLGKGGHDSTTGGHRGIHLQGSVRSTGTIAEAGTIKIDGDGGIGTAGNDGIVIEGPTTIVEAVNGEIEINGSAGNGTGAANRGLAVLDGARVQSTGIEAAAAGIILMGVGGNGTDSNSGVVLGAGTLISTVDGPLFMNGQASNLTTGSFNHGTYLANGSTVKRSGSANPQGYIQINGSGGGTGQAGSNQNQGVRVEGNLTRIEAASGPLRLSGRSGRALTSNNTFQDGVHVTPGVTLQITGLGTLSLSGETVSTDGNTGVGLRLAGTVLASEGSHSLAADRMALDPANLAIHLGASYLEVRPLTAGKAINLGSTLDTATATLELSDDELDTLTASVLILGAQNATSLTVTANLTRVIPTQLHLRTGGDLTLVAGSIDTAGASLSLWPGPLGKISFPHQGTDLIVGNSSDVYLYTGSELTFALHGLTADTQYDQLQVAGKVQLSPVNLQFTGDYIPSAGDSFLLISNQGTGDSSSFANLPEGALFSRTIASLPVTFQITYRGGDGNDVVVTAIDPANPRLQGTAADDDWLVQRVAGDVVVTRNEETVLSAAYEALASLTFDGQAGSDSLSIDLSAGNVIPPGKITFNGGDAANGSGDTLTVFDHSLQAVTFSNLTASGGNVLISGMGELSYTGLEAIHASAPANELVFNLPAGASSALLQDDPTINNHRSQLRSPSGSFVTTTFVNPTASLAIHGGNATGTLTINALPDFTASLAIGTLENPLGIVTVAGAVDLAADNSLTAHAAGSISLTTDSSRLTTSGTGAIFLTTSRSISLAGGSSIISVDGPITLSANQQATPTSGNFIGIDVDGGAVLSTGAGAVVLKGKGGNNSAGHQYGVRVHSGGLIQGDSGGLEIVGEGGASTTSGLNVGVYVDSAGVVSATTGGLVNVHGTGGIGSTGVNDGIRVRGANSAITSFGGTVLVTGHGGGSSLGANMGVQVSDSAQIIAEGSGAVVIDGSGGAAEGMLNVGVRLSSSGLISSSAGDVEINGRGGGLGASLINHGVNIFGGRITAGEDGEVKIRGTGGPASGYENHGVSMVGAEIQTTDGNIEILGQGGGTGTSDNNHGIYAHGRIFVGGTGSVVLQGTGGAGSGADNFGFHLGSNTGMISSAAGTVQITGIEGAGPSGTAIVAERGTVSTAASGGVLTLIGNSINIASAATISAGESGTVALKPLTSGTNINLGQATDLLGGPLGLTDSELDRITAGRLQIGDAASGPITVSATITRSDSTKLSLTSGSTISLSSGAIDTAGANLVLAPGGSSSVSTANAGNDVTLGVAGTLSFASGTNLVFAIDGTVVDTEYQQLNVAGQVNLTDVDLVLSGSFAPPVGSRFTIVNNDAAEPVIGVFTGLPEGHFFTATLGSVPTTLQITYRGGDGNDVVLAVAANPRHNVLRNLDVSGDTHIAPNDSLEIINYINAFGAGSVPASATIGPPYLDVNGDDFVTAADVLDVINYLNAFGPTVTGGNDSGGDGSEGEAEPAAVRSNADKGADSDWLAILAEDLAGAGKRTRR